MSIPVPEHVTRVRGCNCGGLTMHRTDCTIFQIDQTEAMAAVDEAQQRLQEYTAELNRGLLADGEPEHGSRLARHGCALSGHSYDVIAVKPMGGPGRPVSVRCTTCREHWEIKPKETTSTALIVETAPPLAPYFDESE